MSRRRWSTWLVVAGLAAIALIAVADAFREEPEAVGSEAGSTTVTGLGEDRGEAVSRLREAGVSGVLTYSDEDCRLHAVSLPDLEPVRAPSFEMCRPATSTGEFGVLDGDVVWAGLGYGAVQVVIPQEELSRAILGTATARRGGFRALQAVSLDDERLLVLADSALGPEERVLAAFDGTPARFAHLSWLASGAWGIRPSPGGSYYAVLRSEAPGAQVFTREGRAVEAAEPVAGARAVAWSPDERWTALATTDGVYVFASEPPRQPVIRVPLVVRDLDWSEAGLTGSP
jgi:hypothetical protein